MYEPTIEAWLKATRNSNFYIVCPITSKQVDVSAMLFVDDVCRIREVKGWHHFKTGANFGNEVLTIFLGTVA